MKRITVAVVGGLTFFVLAILLVAAVNAPRVMEAEAHRQAAAAMQTQAQVTGLAVGGMLLLVIVLAAGTLGLAGLLAWAVVTGRLVVAGRFATGQRQRLLSRRRPAKLASTHLVYPYYSASHYTLASAGNEGEFDMARIEPDGGTWNGDDFFSW